MKPIETPIIIIGAGLSAVDCAMESLYFYIQTNSNNETLKTIQKNSKVQILYHKTIQESKAYRESPKELEDALSNGVTFTENTKVIGIEKTETNSIKNLLVIQNGNHLKIKM